MQLRLTTDYAIRILLCLAENPQGSVRTLRDISTQVIVSPGYLRKVTSMLKQAKLVVSDQGSQGGFSLARHPSEITLYDVLEACEDTGKLSRSSETNRRCPGYAADDKVQVYLKQIELDMEARLRAVTIEDFR